jgi:hypothetical protein
MLAQTDNTQKWLIVALTAIVTGFALNGCSAGGGSVKGSVSANPSAISINAVYPSSSGVSWSPIVLSSRYYIAGLSITINGSCDRGIATVQVNEGAANYAETANCLVDGSFTWSKTYTGPLDADKTLTLAGYDTTTALISGTSTTVQVHIDNVPPAAPTITTPGSSPFTLTAATGNFILAGTVSADTSVLTVNGANLAFTGTSFTDPVLVADGSTTSYTFNAYDLAGNQSTASSVSIIYAPTLRLGENVDADISGGNIVDTGSGATGFHLEAAMFMNHSTATDSGTSGFFLDTGFNYITNSERAN